MLGAWVPPTLRLRVRLVVMVMQKLCRTQMPRMRRSMTHTTRGERGSGSCTASCLPLW
jgi:hypothetical protein